MSGKSKRAKSAGVGSRGKPLLPERLLSLLWQGRSGGRLRTVDGRRLRVLYPGKPAPGHGPDFRDSVLELDGRLLRGNVEVHRRPEEWKAHGHHQDPAYDSVVLHVVGQDSPWASSPIPDLPVVELTQSVPPPSRLQGSLPKRWPLSRLASAGGEHRGGTL